VFSVFWAAAPALEILSASIGLAGIFPGLLSISRKKIGYLTAMLPLIPMILFLVPFTGDEPHYASITENLISADSSRFSEYSTQRGDPTAGVSHHQSLYPALMIPGYPLSAAGLRSMNLLFALAALLIMSIVLRECEIKDWKKLTVLGFILVPGSSVLGLLYPGWLALAVFLFSVYAALHERKTIWILIAAAILVLVKFRFIGISIGLLLALIIELKGKRKYLILIVLACLAAAALLFDLVALNGRIFWVRYGNMPFLKTLFIQPIYRTPEMLIAAGSTLVDIESGLLWRAPWVLAGLAGLPLLRKNNRRLFLWLGLPALFYYLILMFWTISDWSAMPTPSGRMLLPLLPVLLASLGYMLRKKEVRILIWISLGISAVYFTHPFMRFNFADGTDTLVSGITGSFSSIAEWVPSAVRLSIPVFLFWIAFSIAAVWMLIRNREKLMLYTAVSAFLLLCLLGGMRRTAWEAEDIPPGLRTFCSVYPHETDLESRKYWFFTRERMLRLSHPDDSVVLPISSDTDGSARVIIFHRSFRSGSEIGIELSTRGWCDSIYAVSELLDTPGWMTIVRDIQIPLRPENLEELSSEFFIPAGIYPDSIKIRALGMEECTDSCHGIYLDRILI